MITTTGHRISAHIGRRGAFLALFGIVYLLIGYSYLGDRPTPAVRAALRLAINVAPLWVYGLVWILGGATALIVGLIVPPTRDAVGFIAMITLPTLWACVYFAAWLHNDAPRGWTSALLFALVAFAVAVVSGMPNPVKVPGDIE